ALVQHLMPVWYHAGIMCKDHIAQKGDTMVVDRLRAVIAAAEKLPENEQEQLAALWEETLRDNTRWHELFQQPGSQALFAQLRAEAAEAEQNSTVEDSPDEDWA
ncbi:MAG: hypothetical protein ACXWQZ_19500, partial [Ktedonobacterales bacterium]